MPSPESLLIFSDVHLGSDLNDAGPVAPRSAAIDRDLVRLLAHYRSEPAPAGRWKIVIAGDFIDFVGISVDPGCDDERDLPTPLTDEERANGVGNAEDHARFKLRRVARRHADVFAELAAFVAGGHALTIVSGNHDIEFHWDGVKDEFRALLLTAAPAHLSGDAEAFCARIEFSPLFFYRDGVVYVEHGHQYDPYCASAHPMAPVSPHDPRRIARAFSDVLLRFVVRRTRGMKEHGHEHTGMLTYLRFGLGLGISGMLALAARFARSIVELFRIRRGYLSSAARALAAEHDRRIARFAERSQVGRERLAELFALHAKPIALTVRGILESVLLDRLAVAFVGVIVIAVLAAFQAFHAALGVALGWAAAHLLLSRRRIVDPAEQLVERAGQLARLFPAAFVVMGHTHVPASTPAGDATYINLGSWAEEGEGEYRAARTHLVIRERDGKVEAQFCEWRADEGPRVRSSIG